MRELLQSIIWQNHVPALIRFLSTFVLLVLAIVYNLQVRGELADATSNHSVQSSLLDEAMQSRETLNENIDEYLEYRSKGFIGEPSRLQWIETFRLLADKWLLPSVKFTLGEGRLIEAGEPYFFYESAMRVTPMKIDMQLAHEGDFYELMEGLRNDAGGIFGVDNCKLAWLDSEVTAESLTRLRATCDLNWYTLVDITETWDQGAD